MFPILRVIDISTRAWLRESIISVNQVAAAFLLSRLEAGHPVTMLDMSRHSPPDDPPDLGALSEVRGLKVLYRLSAVNGIIEHTCGSGDPDKIY